MMSHTSEQVNSLLQELCTPVEYSRVTATTRPGHFRPSHATNEYWRYIPNYKVSECPICHQTHLAQIDTYGLANCPISGGLGQSFTDIRHESSHCVHYLAVKHFIHLNGYLPTELSHIEFQSSEVPAIQLNLLPDDIGSFAVLHALPVCRVENGQFVPRYTLFLMTYFSDQPPAIIQRWRDEVDQILQYDPEYYDDLVHNPREPIAYDLQHWVALGRLKWLDLDRKDLALRDGPAEQFPYLNIEGRIKGASYRNGILKESIF